MIQTNNIFEGVENYYIDFANNDMFRVSNDTSDNGYIFDRQINVAKEIVKAFLNKNTRRNHIILNAQMQSGKTSVINATENIIHELKLESIMGINKYFILTGMNDVMLRDQTFTRMIEQVKNANASNSYYTKKHSKHDSNKYFVIKNSDLMAYEGSLDNSVIFIDESHYGSNDKNILSQFLYKHGVNWKDENSLISKNIYIVSVSATPFNEIISDTINVKKCIKLDCDDSYVGVSDYVNGGFIHSGKFEDTVGGIEDILANAYDKMLADDIMGACIVRTRKFDEIKENDFINYWYNVIEIYANGSKIQYKKMYDALDELIQNNGSNTIKPILFLVKGAFRAGITLNTEYKDYIYAVYDYSTKSEATCQALLGRMCGYRSKDSILRTHFYINDTMASMYSKWVESDYNKELTPCDKTTEDWLSSVDEFTNDTVLSSKSCGNFAINMSTDEIESIYKQCKGKKVCRARMMALLPQILENHGISIKYDYFSEAYMSGKNNYADSSQMKRFNSFSEKSMVFGFRPNKIKEFDHDCLTEDDFGKRCVTVVLDSEIDKESGKVIGGNNRLLVYYVEVGAYKLIPNQMSMYKAHKDTDLSK